MNSKNTILQVSLELFAAQGYEATGVQQIVTKANITKPTLYHFFGSKRGLLDAVIELHYKEMQSVLASAAQYNKDLTKTLCAILKSLSDFAMLNKDFYRFVLIASHASPQSEPFQAIAPYIEQSMQTLEELFRKAVVQHGNMRGRHQRYAFTLWGMVNNYITLALSNQITLNDESIFLAVHQFSHGIYS
jgi:TetR/AcrR family transcriptional regulator